MHVIIVCCISDAHLGMSSMFDRRGAPQKQFASERVASNCQTAVAAIVVQLLVGLDDSRAVAVFDVICC